MKKSLAVPATLVIVVAATISTTGCSPQKDCVDKDGVVVNSSHCRTGRAGYSYVPRSGGFGSSSSSPIVGG